MIILEALVSPITVTKYFLIKCKKRDIINYQSIKPPDGLDFTNLD